MRSFARSTMRALGERLVTGIAMTSPQDFRHPSHLFALALAASSQSHLVKAGD
ncbi:MAG: hypothetical protein ACR2NZ_15195 [Rubripirellula sp.]